MAEIHGLGSVSFAAKLASRWITRSPLRSARVIRRRRLISASELSTWCYCHKAWHFERLGYPSSLAQDRAAGSRYHQSRDQTLRAAIRARTAAATVILICLAVMMFLATRSLRMP